VLLEGIRKKIKKQMRKKILLVVVFILPIIGLLAQTQVTAGGGEASSSAGIVSYSVGQVAYQSYITSNGTIAEGIQQAYEISTLIGIEDKTISLVQVVLYPNPVTDYLILSVKTQDIASQKPQDVAFQQTQDIASQQYITSQQLQFQLYDLQGKLVQSQKLTDSETQINMRGYVPSTYYIKVTLENKLVEEFKVVKN